MSLLTRNHEVTLLFQTGTTPNVEVAGRQLHGVLRGLISRVQNQTACWIYSTVDPND